MRKNIHILLISLLVLFSNNFIYGNDLKLLPAPESLLGNSSGKQNIETATSIAVSQSSSNLANKEQTVASGMQPSDNLINKQQTVASGNSFAPTDKDIKNKEQEAQKMTQLKQILAQISSGESNINSVNSQNVAPSVLPTSPVTVVPSPEVSAPAVGLATGAKKSPDLYDAAFSGVVGEMLPMSPAQINKLKEVFVDTQLAVATPPGVPPKPTTSSILVNLSPKATPPVIRLSARYLTSLVFIDATGQPWPIAAFSVGDPTSFNIQWDRKSNTLFAQAMSFFKTSNIAVMLKDLNTPVMITLMSGQQAVDYRIDLRIPGVGPNAVYVQNGVPDAVNPILFDVLNGVTPKGAKELKVSGSGSTQAWLLDKKMYLRTNLTITSPGWQSTMSSADGTHAYQLQPTPAISALLQGKDKPIRVVIEGL